MTSFILIPLLIGSVLSSTVYWYDKTQLLANRQTMVHLFEWKWTDVAKECENFLQYYGYGAVQVSPPMEHITLVQNNDMPWWTRYQPVSYKLVSRSGNETEFKDMVDRCNKVGIRIIVDVVLNHMVGVSQKSGVDSRGSSGGTFFDGTDGIESFPGVPYNSSDFNDHRCHGNIQSNDYHSNAINLGTLVRNCRLVGLLDLDQGKQKVRNSMITFLNKLIDYGIAGFRLDASKHMWPGDLEIILNGIKNLRKDIFGVNQRPFVAHEVIDRGGESVKCADYLTIGRYTNFNFGAAVSEAAKGQLDWKNLAHLGPGYKYGNNEDHDVLNFIDNHDNQREPFPYVVTYKDGEAYKMAVAFMLAWPYGFPRVMSSFFFDQQNQGPPNLGSNSGYATTSPIFNSDLTCDSKSGWVCEHRWPSMTKFRSAVQGTAAAEISTNTQRISFAREGKGFFALSASGEIWKRVFQTTLPAGQYCDQYSGSLQNGKCTGETITVNDDGSALLTINFMSVVAFSLASRIGGPPAMKHAPNTWQKTIILLKRHTNPGENIFIRGGTNSIHSTKCSTGPHQQPFDECAVPIRHNTTVPFIFSEYISWSQRDDYLDFEGDEEKQGTHDGQIAVGTPLAYSTNDKGALEYQPYNTYGPDYWIVELLMDCTKTEQGWFELKGYHTPSVGWEPNISQQPCSGSIGGSAPFSSINHIAKCGAVNVFSWGANDCVVSSN